MPSADGGGRRAPTHGTCMRDGSRALDRIMFFGALTTTDWMVDELGCALDAHNDTHARLRMHALRWLLARGADFDAHNDHAQGCLNKAAWEGTYRA
eukprot:jgi/Tetstr1/455913/TSEL_042694.t1